MSINLKLLLGKFGKLKPQFSLDNSKGLLMTYGINVLIVIIIVLAVITLLNILNEKYQSEKLFGKVKNRNLKRSIIKKMKFFKEYYSNLEILLNERGKEGLLNTLFNATIILLVFLFVYFISVKQILLAVVAPIIIAKSLNKIVSLLSNNIMEQIEEQLPFAIDNIIRISSKYGDLKNIIYEASRTSEYPLKNILEKVSRKMISGNTENVLLEFAEEYDNVWIYSLVFTLLSYVQDANKEDTIKNLKHLRDILEKENRLKKVNVTDKRYGVVINYALAGIAGVIGIINLVFNPAGKQFFFGSFIGLICFTGGYCLVILTIIVNIKMSKVNKTNKTK